MILNSSQSSATIKIGIIENRTIEHEKDEEFIVNLSFPGEPIPRVILKPDRAIVTIIEFDGEGIHIHYSHHLMHVCNLWETIPVLLAHL